MKISIVTSVLNRANTVLDTVSSIQRQSYPLIEHIVQDGGSTDGTLELLSRFRSSNMHFESGRDSGIYDGINRGIYRSTGDVVGLLHSDDVFAHDDVLANVAQAFLDPNVSGLYGDLVYVSADDLGRVLRFWKSGPYDVARFRRGWMPPHPTVFLRREVFEKFGVYDTSYRIAADYEAMLRYFAIGGIKPYYLKEVMVLMRQGGESNRSIGRIVCKSVEDYRALRHHKVGGFGTLIAKNLRKVSQFCRRDEFIR